MAAVEHVVPFLLGGHLSAFYLAGSGNGLDQFFLLCVLHKKLKSSFRVHLLQFWKM